MKYLLFNPFNEKYYDNEEEFNKKRKTFSEIALKEYVYKNQIEKDNQSLLYLYKHYLEEIKDLLDFIKITGDDLEKALVIEYLIHKGIFSENKKFIIKKPNKEITRYNGINIILGEGVCRHVSGFYLDLFKDIYKYPLKYSCYISNKQNSFIVKRHISNHVINLAYHNDILYGIDLLNKDIFTFKSEFQMENINYNIKKYLRYKPFFDVIGSLDGINLLENNLSLFKANVYINHLTFFEIKQMRNRIYNELNEKERLINGFSNDTEPIKKEIKNKMLSLR